MSSLSFALISEWKSAKQVRACEHVSMTMKPEAARSMSIESRAKRETAMVSYSISIG